MYLEIIHNLSLLIALSVVAVFIENRLPSRTSLGGGLQGLVFGGAAVLGMLQPLTVGPGLIFDGRSIMVSLCAYFFGPWAAGIAAVITASCRIYLGGVGVVTGCLVIGASAGIGLLARFWHDPERQIPSTAKLYLFGFIVHLAMLGLMFTLPGGKGWLIVEKMGLPILLFYPLTTVLTGKILTDQLLYRQTLVSLQKSERRLIDAQYIAKLGDFTWDVETGEMTFSSSFLDLLKYPSEEVINYSRLTGKILHPDDRERVARWLDDCLASGKNVLSPYDYRLVRSDDGVISVRTTGMIKRGNGKSATIFATVQDVTEQKITERKILDSEKLFATIFESSSLGINLFRASDNRSYKVNRAYLDIIGYSREEVEGHTAAELGLFIDDSARGIWMKELQEKGRVFAQNARIRHKSGVVKNLMASMDLIEVSGEQMVLVIISDISDLVLAEERLHHALLQQNEAVKAANVGLWEWDLGSNRMTYSREWKKQIGFQDEGIGNGIDEWRERVHPDDYEHVAQAMQKSACDAGSPYSVEFRFRHRDGLYRWILSRASVIRDEGGKALKMIGSHIDITDRKLIETAALENMERYRMLFENMIAGFVLFEVVVDDDGRPEDLTIVAANDGFSTTTGLDVEKVAGSRLTLVLPGIEDDPAGWIQVYSEVALTGEPKQFEQGSALLGRWFSVIAYQAGPMQCAVLFEDITKRKQLENDLQLSLERYAKAQEMGHVGNWEYDVGEKKIWGSAEARRICGLDAARDSFTMAEVGKCIVEWKKVRQKLLLFVKGEEPFDTTFTLHAREANSSGKHVRSIAEVSRDASGKPVAIRGVLQDITVQKESEDALRRYRDQLAEFNIYLQKAIEREKIAIAREIHDDLGQIMSSLKMDLGWVGKRLQPGQEVVGDKIVEMQTTLTQCLQSVKHLCSELRPVILDDLGIEPALRWFAEQASQRMGITIELHIDFKGFEADRDLSTSLFRMVQESLTNVARHALAKKVTISLVADAETLVLRIEDDGIGIQAIDEHKSFGIVGMRERAHSHNGTFMAGRRQQGGTVIEAVFPLTQQPATAS